MNDLHLDFEWIDPNGAKGPELRATWAQLRIVVGNKVVSRVLDRNAKSVREHLFLPLYPLAEWIAYNWWALLNEPENPARQTTRTYLDRHNLHCAREGFYLPSLSLIPIDTARLRAVWRGAADPHERLDFVESGSEVLDKEQVTNELETLIEAVVSRLRDTGIQDSALLDEWRSIQSANDEEVQFCKAVGMMGQDPYSLSESLAAQVVQTDHNVPTSLHDEFFSVADPDNLTEAESALTQALTKVRNQREDLRRLKELRGDIQRNPISAVLPWERGYTVAQRVRELLSIGHRSLSSDDDLAGVLEVTPGAWLNGENPGYVFDAVTDINAHDSPGFWVPSQHRLSRRFAFCRALHEYLAASDRPTAIVSRAYTDRQKCNRAFAAEFLAPAQAIRERIPGDRVDEFEIGDLANMFGVSTRIIEHQIANQLPDITVDFVVE